MNINHASDKELARATEIAALLWKHIDGEAITRAECNDICIKLKCSRSSVYRHLAKLKKNFVATDLVNQKRGRKPLSRFITKSHEDIVESQINQFYLTRTGQSFGSLYRRCVVEFQKAGLVPVDRGTVLSRLNAIEPRKLIKKRAGAKAAADRYDIVKGHLNASRPLQIVQIDHTKLDVFVVSAITRKSLGRPFLTICLDIATRMILGFRISLEAPSALSLSKAFSSSVLPKENSTDFCAFGLPENVHTDNGSDLTGSAFSLGLQKHGIGHIKRPPACPKYGGHVERMFRTLNSYIHELPGTTKSNLSKRSNQDPRKTACLTLEELKAGLSSYIGSVYHRKVHSALHRTPIEAWNRWWNTSQDLPRLPVDASQFQLDFLPFETRKITNHGIQFERLYYRSAHLQKLRNLGVKSLRFRVDPDDIRTIFGLDERNNPFEIMCEKQFHQKITLCEWKRVREPALGNIQCLSDADLIRHYQKNDSLIKKAKNAKCKRVSAKRRKNNLECDTHSTTNNIITPYKLDFSFGGYEQK